MFDYFLMLCQIFSKTDKIKRLGRYVRHLVAPGDQVLGTTDFYQNSIFEPMKKYAITLARTTVCLQSQSPMGLNKSVISVTVKTKYGINLF